jgi:hypothetical protein
LWRRWYVNDESMEGKMIDLLRSLLGIVLFVLLLFIGLRRPRWSTVLIVAAVGVVLAATAVIGTYFVADDYYDEHPDEDGLGLLLIAAVFAGGLVQLVVWIAEAAVGVVISQRRQRRDRRNDWPPLSKQSPNAHA